MRTTKYKIEFLKDICEYNYKEGETGELEDMGCPYICEASSIDEVWMKIKENFPDARTSDFEVFSDHIQLSTVENKAGQYPNDFEFELFKQGKIVLYNVYWQFHITKIDEVYLDNDALEKAFPHLHNEGDY